MSESLQTNNITVIATLPKFREQGGGTIGWWEGDIGEQRLDSLKKAFLYGASDEEACYIAGIKKQSLYYYIRNKNSEFGEEKEQLKLNVVFSARRTVVKAIGTNPDMAWRFLAKKIPREFGENSEGSIINNFGTINTQINKEYFEVPENVDELLNDGTKIIPAN